MTHTSNILWTIEMDYTIQCTKLRCDSFGTSSLFQPCQFVQLPKGSDRWWNHEGFIVNADLQDKSKIMSILERTEFCRGSGIEKLQHL